MTRKRFFGFFLGIAGAAVLALILYLAVADLGRHKARIEALVARSVGRPFTIDGPFSLKLFPVIEVRAENVRLGNVQGGTQPHMIEFGKAVIQVGFWSLISGPPDVRLFELHDATVLLEYGPDGRGNWVMGSPPVKMADPEELAEEESLEDAEGLLEVPVVIQRAQLQNVRLIYREPRKRDRVVRLDELGIGPGEGDMLAVAGVGKLDTYAMRLEGELGSLRSLLSARDMRIDMQMSLGELALDIRGVVGSLNPLDGVNLVLSAEQPDVGAMLTRLELPVLATGPLRIDSRLKDAGALTQVELTAHAGDLKASALGAIRTLSLKDADLSIHLEHAEGDALLQALGLPALASGPLRIDTRLKDAGKRRQVDLEAKWGDLEARVKGTLRSRSLMGSDLEIEASAADAARLARVFEWGGVPAAPLNVTAHLTTSRKQFKFDPLTAVIAGATVSAKGALQRSRDHAASFQFDATAESLAKLEPTWPAIPSSARGALELTNGRIEAKGLEVTLGENQLAGSFVLAGKRQVDAEITSPRLDLSPFLATQQPGAARVATPAAAAKKKFLFDESPLKMERMKDTDAKVHLVAGELKFGERSLRNVDGNLRVEHGKMEFEFRAAGVHDGTIESAGTLTPGIDGTVALELKANLTNVRASPASDGIAPGDVPPLGLALNLRIHGSSPREMASGANGHLVLTQGSGRIRSGLLGALGDGVLGQLGQKLNPFSKVDPFMKLDCTVARADIVDGQVTVKPLVVQSEKVTVTAHGTIDLHTEKLSIDFNTRPRKGIGVSPGMFTNPLIRLEGTLVSPRIGVGAKGFASGAVAAATGGVTVVAGGLLDRMVGEQDICPKTLAAATAGGAR